MKALLYKLTPVSIVCLLGFIYLIYQLFVTSKDKNILAYIIIFIIFLFVAFALDRFLVSKVDYNKLFVAELIFMAVSFIGYLYANKTTMINIVTNNDYFFVLYDDDGLGNEDIPTKGLFDKETTISADSNVHVNKALEYNVQINTPKAWNYNFISKKKEIIISNKKIIIEIYARNLNEQQADVKLNEEMLRLHKAKE